LLQQGNKLVAIVTTHGPEVFGDLFQFSVANALLCRAEPRIGLHLQTESGLSEVTGADRRSVVAHIDLGVQRRTARKIARLNRSFFQALNKVQQLRAEMQRHSTL
jgi:hypothetical protein